MTGYLALPKLKFARFIPVAIVSTALLILVLISLPNVALNVHAGGEPAYCSTIGGQWDSVSSTCTLTGYDSASPDTSLEVTSGTTLVLACSPSICNEGGDGLLFESNGSLTVDQGATVLVESNFTCSQSCFDNSIDLDGSGTAIINQGTIVIEPLLACSQSGWCLGMDIDGGSISNYGVIQIGGNYSCDNTSFCYGTLNDNGNFVDINCGSTSPQSQPYFDGSAVSSSGGCATTTLTQTVHDTETLTHTINSKSTETQTLTSTLTKGSTVTDSSLQTVSVTSTSYSLSDVTVQHTSNVTVTHSMTNSAAPSSSSGSLLTFVAAGISIGIISTIGFLFARKRFF